MKIKSIGNIKDAKQWMKKFNPEIKFFQSAGEYGDYYTFLGEWSDEADSWDEDDEEEEDIEEESDENIGEEPQKDIGRGIFRWISGR